MIQLGCMTGCGSTAWVQRHAANPSVGVRRQLPLHKGGPVAGRPYCLCLGSLCLPGKREYDSPGTGLAQRGSTAAPLVQRGDSMAGPCRGDCKARQMIQLGAVIGCGSTAWPSRHGTGSTAWERRLAVNPSVGVRRQLPLHKGAVFAFLHRACQLHNKKLPHWGSFFCIWLASVARRGSAI